MSADKKNSVNSDYISQLSLKPIEQKNASQAVSVSPDLDDPEVIKAMEKIKFSMGLSNLGLSMNSTPSKSPMNLVSVPDSLEENGNEQVLESSCDGESSGSSCPEMAKLVCQKTHMGEQFNPKIIRELNYFAFETLTRTKIKQLVQPLYDLQVQDRQSLVDVQRIFRQYDERLKFVEGIFEEHKGKNVVFDQMQEKLVNNEVERVKFSQRIEGMVNIIKDSQEMVLMKLENHKIQIDNNSVLMDKLKEQQVADIKTQLNVNQKLLDNISHNHSSVLDTIHKVKTQVNTNSHKFQKFVEQCETNTEVIRRNFKNIEALQKDLKKLQDDYILLKSESAKESVQIQRFTEIENMLKHYNFSIDHIKNSIQTTDNYVDKYLGFKMIKNLMATLKEIYEDDSDDLTLTQQQTSVGSKLNIKKQQFSYQNQQKSNQDVLDKICKVESVKLKELYVKMMADTGQPPEFKTQMDALQKSLSEKFPQFFKEQKKNELGLDKGQHNFTSRRFLTLSAEQSEQQVNVNQVKKEANEYIFKRELSNNDEDSKKMFRDLCDTLMRFLGPDDISPEMNKKFSRIHQRLGKIEQDMLQYDYTIQQCKGLSSDAINSKIEEKSMIQDMKMKQVQTQLEYVQNQVSEDSMKHDTTIAKIESFQEEIQGMKNRMERKEQVGNNMSQMSKKSSKRTIEPSVEKNPKIQEQISNIAKVCVILIENALIEQGITQQVSKKKVLPTTTFQTPHEMSKIDEHESLIRNNSSVLIQNSSHNPHRRIKSYLDGDGSESKKSHIFVKQSVHPPLKNQYFRQSADIDAQGAYYSMQPTQRQLRPSTSQGVYSHSKGQDSRITSARILKSEVHDTSQQMIYADKIFEVETLTKIRGQLLNRCWHDFSKMEPFCDKNVRSIVGYYFRQTGKNNISVDQQTIGVSEQSEIDNVVLGAAMSSNNLESTGNTLYRFKKQK